MRQDRAQRRPIGVARFRQIRPCLAGISGFYGAVLELLMCGGFFAEEVLHEADVEHVRSLAREMLAGIGAAPWEGEGARRAVGLHGCVAAVGPEIEDMVALLAT